MTVMAEMSKEREMAIVSFMRAHLRKMQDAQRLRRFGPDAAFKLNVHFPTVTSVAERMFPDDYVLQAAADFHDYGRIPQLVTTGSFNDGSFGSAKDHHVIGRDLFYHDMKNVLVNSGLMSSVEFDFSMRAGFLHRISQAILLHGLRGKAFEAEFMMLDTETERIVDLVSMIDDVANGTQCAGYLLRECQEQAKNVSMGGFIPDENAELRTVSQNVIRLFAESQVFDRNAECQTYADYVIFGAFLATRSLKNSETRIIARAAMEQPVQVWHYVYNELVMTEYANAAVALERIFDYVMEEPFARQAKQILWSYL